MATKRTNQTTSKFLSLVLRHRPDTIGIALEKDGWTQVDALLAACEAYGRPLSRDTLDEIVACDAKNRFAYSTDRTSIRANQGHSAAVELAYLSSPPPPILYHGTVERFLPQIREVGLLRMNRHHVHLSRDEATAREVGKRRGRPIVLQVDAHAMQEAGYIFYRAPNGVWLTDTVPWPFIQVLGAYEAKPK
jgi:putative RNA 2'-phosphotransferase